VLAVVPSLAKKGFRSVLTKHEIALIGELLEQGMSLREVADRIGGQA
jgi:hypothetical protein